MSVVIPRNTCIPVKKTKGYVTVEDNQTSSLIKVYEGERKRASDNNLLGSFCLSGHTLAPRGHPYDVCFAIDENGILTVSATNIASGNSNETTITNYKERLSDDEINKLIQEAENFQIEDKKFLKKGEAVNALENYIYKMRNAIKKDDINLKLSLPEIMKIESAITLATTLLDEKDHHNDSNVLENHLKELKIEFDYIIAKSFVVWPCI
jgi:L1 cell adhesion molecule like protein